MGWWLLFAVFLFVACAALIVAEVFIPSGGILSVCALACVVGGIVICFNFGAVAGWVSILAALVMIPLLLASAYRVLPKTRFGRQVILARPVRERGDAIADGAELAQLLGAVGTVVTPLRPVGSCSFAGRRVECVAESGYVRKGETIKVIRVEGTQLTVRVTDET
jgi:membrane-bound serine protease (ClpP class)